ncbi:MAG: MoxR family ATPase, partial [Yaniella sp.]|nr:MoxR family ATPase [Yaniella sp.]
NEEIEILNRHATGFRPTDLIAAGLKAVANQQTIEAARSEIAQVKTSPEVLAYIVDLVQATRSSPSFQTGVSPRGSTALMKTAKAWAWLIGREFITPDDVQSLVLPCLRHRVSLRPEAEMDGVSVDQVLQGLIATVPVPR